MSTPATPGAAGAPTPTIADLVVADTPEAWAAAGFAVDPDGTCRIGSVRLRLSGPAAGERIASWSLRDADLADVIVDGRFDGVPTTASDQPPAEPGQHANGVRNIDHLVMSTPDLPRTVALLRRIGLEPRRTRDIGNNRYQVFYRMAEVILELVGPDPATGDGPSGFFGLAYTVADLEVTQAYYGERLPFLKPAVQPGRLIGTLRHKEFGMTVPTAFLTPEAVG